MRSFRLLLLGVGIMIMITGCSSNKEDAFPHQDIVISNEDVWTIPVLSDITGPISFVGNPAAWSAEYAAEVINEMGGINGKDVDVVIYDTGFDSKRALSIIKHVLKGALTVVGPIDVPGSEAVGATVYKEKVPTIGAYTFQKIRKRYAPYTVAYMTDSEEGDWLAVQKWAQLNPDIGTVIIFTTPTDASQMATVDLLKKKLPTIGIEVLEIIEVETDTLDCGPAAVQAINLGSDGYISVMRATESAKIVSELRMRGTDQGRKITCGFSSFSSEYIDKVGEAFLDDTYIWSKLDPFYEGQDWLELKEAYKARFDGVAPTAIPVPEYYNALLAIKQCYEELGITGEQDKVEEEKVAIANWFYNSPVIHGIQGDFQWVKGKKISDIYYFQFKDDVPVKVN